MTTSSVWFITGASSGFGRAFAEYAISRQYRVVATARSLKAVEALAEQHPELVLTLPRSCSD
ncbi:MAG TPA: SDR family NAD(P)-dependent oxidoreductase [Terracidiphilus sp.]|jgi:NADP-dependent 3-hydroxy acid dehydrogenase YdfG